MPFVKRDVHGQITLISNEKGPATPEEVDADNAEFLNYLSGMQSTQADRPLLETEELLNLRLSDLGVIRVIDDLIEILIQKDVIQINDLPKVAIQRLQQRRLMRDKLAPASKIFTQTKDSNVMNPDTWLGDGE